MSKQFFESPAEARLKKFEDKSLQIGPNKPGWENRVKEEMWNIKAYLDFLSEHSKGRGLWFRLTPIREKRYNYQVWEGYLKIPGREDITFDMVVLLPREYPKVFPRAFVEENIIDYAKKNIYINSRFPKDGTHNGKSYVMICHDHLDELDVWHPSLSISHFLLREILIWWNARTETIIQEWDGSH